MEQHYGVIIRADGTVPFDDEVSTVHRQAMIEGLKAMGHDVYYCPIANEHKIRDFNADLERA
jgi:hypothetical protein